MNNKFPELKKAIESARAIEISQAGGKYKFKILAFGERGTKLNANLIKEINFGLTESIKQNFSDFDYIISPEPRGHMWGLLVASELGKPINILRTQPSYGTNETEVARRTGYYQHNLYFENFKKGDKVLILDDVISTGGTISVILETLKKL